MANRHLNIVIWNCSCELEAARPELGLLHPLEHRESQQSAATGSRSDELQLTDGDDHDVLRVQGLVGAAAAGAG